MLYKFIFICYYKQKDKIMKYEVTMVSKDNNTFIYYCSANSVEDAKQYAKDKIVTKGWDMYHYKITRVRVK